MKTDFKKVAKKKHRSSKKTGYSGLVLRKPNFKTQIIPVEKSHNDENCERGPLRLFNIILLQNFKKTEGRPFGVFRIIFEIKTKNEKFEQSHSAEKSEKRDPLGFSNIRSVAKYQTN